MYCFSRAISESDRSKAFRLRYDVYCTEKNWLDSASYPDLMETDREDARSIVFLACDKDGKAVGTVRLIVNNEYGSAHPLPISRHPSIQGKIDTLSSLEISRFSILESKRSGEVSIGLIRLLFLTVLTEYKNAAFLYFSVEDRFLSTLNLLGFEFRPIAEGADWYGDFLIPSFQKISTIDDSIRKRNPFFYKWLWDGDLFRNEGSEKLLFFIKHFIKKKGGLDALQQNCTGESAIGRRGGEMYR